MMIAKNLISTMLTVLLLWGIVASAYDSPPAIPDNTIYGHVFDAQTGKPLSSVLMYCLTCSPNMTNSKGYYEFGRCFSALTTYTIDCVKTGYRKYSRTVTTDLRGKAQVDFYIQPEVRTAFTNATSILASVQKQALRGLGVAGEVLPGELDLNHWAEGSYE